MRHALILSTLALATLTGCGKAGGLERTEQMGPQPIAYGALEAESRNQLTRPSKQAIPGRSSTLINSSQPRRRDPFDVPPGAANMPFPGDAVTADFESEGSASATEIDDDGA